MWFFRILCGRVRCPTALRRHCCLCDSARQPRSPDNRHAAAPLRRPRKAPDRTAKPPIPHSPQALRKGLVKADGLFHWNASPPKRGRRAATAAHKRPWALPIRTFLGNSVTVAYRFFLQIFDQYQAVFQNNPIKSHPLWAFSTRLQNPVAVERRPLICKLKLTCRYLSPIVYS